MVNSIVNVQVNVTPQERKGADAMKQLTDTHLQIVDGSASIDNGFDTVNS